MASDGEKDKAPPCTHSRIAFWEFDVQNDYEEPCLLVLLYCYVMWNWRGARSAHVISLNSLFQILNFLGHKKSLYLSH